MEKARRRPRQIWGDKEEDEGTRVENIPRFQKEEEEYRWKKQTVLDETT